MPDYQLSKIYKLWSPSTNLIYIGSTTQTIAQRLADHLNKFKQYKNDKGHNVSSFKILECEDYKIELIENYPCNNKEQLFKKEGEHIKNIDCVNKKIEGRTDKEYYNDNKTKFKEYSREYYKDNKEQKKINRENNKDKKKEYDKAYNEKNKEKNKEQTKEYYENNKEKIKEQQKEYREKKKLEQKK